MACTAWTPVLYLYRTCIALYFHRDEAVQMYVPIPTNVMVSIMCVDVMAECFRRQCLGDMKCFVHDLDWRSLFQTWLGPAWGS